jgi:hypothetical protein
VPSPWEAASSSAAALPPSRRRNRLRLPTVTGTEGGAAGVAPPPNVRAPAGADPSGAVPPGPPPPLATGAAAAGPMKSWGGERHLGQVR